MIWLLRNTPNILTALRLAAAPALVLLLLNADYDAALAVFVFAGLSDAADGYLAKRFKLTTRFGRYLDPAADKLLMLAAFVTLTHLAIVPFWLTALVIARDLAIVLGVGLARMMALPLRVVPLFVGKVSTVVQVSYIALVLLILAAGLDWPRTALAAAAIAGAATAVSGIAYAQLWFRALARSGSTAA